MADYSVTYDQLDALLQGLDPNTADAPYEIEIATVTASFLTGGGDSPAYGSLRYVLCQNPSKYVSLTWGADALSVIERLSAQPSSEQIYFTAINFLWGATSLVSIDMSHFFSVGGLWMNSFARCTSLKALDLSNLEIPNFSHLANGCTSLEYVNMTGLTSLYKSEGTFVNCSSLREVNLAGCDNIENSRLMFFGCSNLTSITLPDMSKNMDVSGMFSGCSSLEEIHNWTVPVEADYGRVSGSEDIRCFAGCTSLEHIYTNDTPSQESSWNAWDIRKDTANNQSTVTVYKPDGTSNSVSVPSAGTYTMKVTDKVDELLFSPSEGIPAATIQKMLQTKAPITAKDALDPTKDNFMLLAKDRSSARTNVTTDVIEAGNKLPPTSEAVRAAIGSVVPVESVNYEMVEKEVGAFFGKKLYEKSFIIRENGVNSSNWSGSPGVAPTFTYNGSEMDNWSEVVDYSLICISSNKKSMIKIDCYTGGVVGTDWPYGAQIRNVGKSVYIAIRDTYDTYMPNIYIKYFYLKND